MVEYVGSVVGKTAGVCGKIAVEEYMVFVDDIGVVAVSQCQQNYKRVCQDAHAPDSDRWVHCMGETLVAKAGDNARWPEEE